jgi:hypothetical protein
MANELHDFIPVLNTNSLASEAANEWQILCEVIDVFSEVTSDLSSIRMVIVQLLSELLAFTLPLGDTRSNVLRISAVQSFILPVLQITGHLSSHGDKVTEWFERSRQFSKVWIDRILNFKHGLSFIEFLHFVEGS